MNRMLSLKNKDLNEFVKCPICKGYLIDSFTINECLHSFCKSCIIKYIKRKECCPVCKVAINKDRMKLFVKRDVNLQYIVYKLVPGLFKSEMQRRRIFYAKHPRAIKCDLEFHTHKHLNLLKKRRMFDNEAVGKELGEEFDCVFEKHNDISLSIEYSETGISEICETARAKEMDPPNSKCYLLCPATMTIDLLKKFLSLKHKNTRTSMMDIMYDDKALGKDMTLLDIGYIYAWRRKSPMRLFYRIKPEPPIENVTKPIESTVSETIHSTEPIRGETSDKEKSEHLKIHTDSQSEMSRETPEKHLPEPAIDLEKLPEKTGETFVNKNCSNEIIKQELSESQLPAMSTEISDKNEENFTEEMSVDTTNETQLIDNNDQTMNDQNPDANTTQLNNQTLNEHMTITSMMASIESAARLKDTNNEEHSDPKEIKEQLTNSNDSSSKLINIENSGKLDICSSSSDKENTDVVKITEQEVHNGQNVVQVKQTCMTENVLISKENSKVVEVNCENPPNKSGDDTIKAKAKKHPAAPGSAGGVAKKKKDALSSNNESNGVNLKTGTATTLPKKPKVVKPKKLTAKQQQQLQNQSLDLNHKPNIQIKQQPIESVQNTNVFQSSENITQQLQFPQVKLERSYSPQQAYNASHQTFQHQIQQQFSLPGAQSLYNMHNNNTNNKNNSNNNNNNNNTNNKFPSMTNILAGAPSTNNNNHMMTNNFQLTSMSLMNHFLNNQQQQQQQDIYSQNWNQINSNQLVANALQMSQKLNPQLFEFFQSKAQNFPQTQPQQQPQQQTPNFFSPHLQHTQQLFKNQYDDYKKSTFSIQPYQDMTLGSATSHPYFNQANRMLSNNSPLLSYPQQQVISNNGSNSMSSNEAMSSSDNGKSGQLRSIISESCNLVNELN